MNFQKQKLLERKRRESLKASGNDLLEPDVLGLSKPNSNFIQPKACRDPTTETSVKSDHLFRLLSSMEAIIPIGKTYLLK